MARDASTGLMPQLLGGGESVHTLGQFALAAGGGVLVDAATGGHAVDHLLHFSQFVAGGLLVAGSDGGSDFLELQTHHALAVAIAKAALGVLTDAFVGGKRMGLERSPEYFEPGPPDRSGRALGKLVLWQESADYSSGDGVKPQMHTDDHGCRMGKRKGRGLSGP